MTMMMMTTTMTMTTQSSGSSACRNAISRSTTAEVNWCSRRRPSSRTTTTTVALTTKRPAVRCRSLHDDSCGGSAGADWELVDEGMPVLRRRILEMKLAAAAAERAEREEDSIWDETPEEEWRGGQDKKLRGGGGDGQLFHVLRDFMMTSRPGVAVGIAGFLMLSVLASLFLAVFSRLLVEWQRLQFNMSKGCRG